MRSLADWTWKSTFSSTEAALLLASTKNRDLWPGPTMGLTMRRELVAYTGPIRFVRLDSEHARRDGMSVNRGLPVLDLPRGRDSWC